MIPPAVAGFFAKHGATVGKWAIVIGLFGTCLLLAFCYGGESEKTEQLENTVEIERDNSTANEQADLDRLEDVVTIKEQKEELDDAVKSGESRDDLRRRRGCYILRQQAGHATGLPECSRFETDGGAAVPD